jgi:alpha-glucosidase
MKFLSAVPTVWDDTIPLDAKVGEYVVMARRTGDQWYIGAMTDWTPRELKVDLSFLPEGTYELESWSDGVNADRNGQDFRYRTQQISSTGKLSIELAPGGGWTGRIKSVSAASKVSLSAP